MDFTNMLIPLELMTIVCSGRPRSGVLDLRWMTEEKQA
jgi:hypothetical protein